MCRQFHEPLDTCIVHNETRCLPFSHPHLQASSHSHDNSKAGGLDKEVLRFPRLIQSLPQREIGTSSENEDNHSEISDEEDIYDNIGMGTGCMSMTEALHYLHSSDDDDVVKRTASLRRATIERLESIRGKMPPRTTTTVYFDNPYDLNRTYLEDALRHLNDLDDQDGEFSDSSSNYCPSFDGEEGYHWDPWSGLQCFADHDAPYIMAGQSTQPRTTSVRHTTGRSATPAQLMHARMVSCTLHSRLQRCRTSIGTRWPFIDYNNLEPRHQKYSPHRRPSPRRSLVLTIPLSIVTRTLPLLPITNLPSPSYIRATYTVNAFLRHLPLPCKDPVKTFYRRRLSDTRHALCPLPTTEFTSHSTTPTEQASSQQHQHRHQRIPTSGVHGDSVLFPAPSTVSN